MCRSLSAPSFNAVIISSPDDPFFFLFFFNDTATTEIYTLSLHDALPTSNQATSCPLRFTDTSFMRSRICSLVGTRSEEHTSELQSPCNLVCRLLLEKKKSASQPSSAFTSALLPSYSSHSSVRHVITCACS